MITRPIGARLIEVIELCEEHGGLTYKELHALAYPEMNPQTVSTFCVRATEYKLLRFDEAWPRKYYAIEGWRDSRYMPKKIEIKSKNQIITPKGCSFIFQMGAA
jgi:hypothetical protein